MREQVHQRNHSCANIGENTLNTTAIHMDLRIAITLLEESMMVILSVFRYMRV